MITSFFPLILVFAAQFLQEEKAGADQGSGAVSQPPLRGQLKIFCDCVKEPAILKPIMFIFLFMSMPSPGTAMFYFYINVLQFPPEFLG